jgi:hypothetical protein
LREWEFRYRKPRPVIARSDPLKQAAHKKTPPPAATPLTRVTKFHLIKADADDRPVILLNLTLCIHQRHGARHVFALIENLDCSPPSHLLAVANLTQIQYVSLDNSAIGYTAVLNHTPIVMHLTVLFACAASQKHDGSRL